MLEQADFYIRKNYYGVIIGVGILLFIFGLVIGLSISNYNENENSTGCPTVNENENSTINLMYKLLLWDVYDDYSMAMRDMEAAADLIKANYYAQHLDYPYRSEWVLEKPDPEFFADDAMKQMDNALERLTKTNWPDEYKDEVTQLQTYISEVRQLVLRMQEIAHKSSYGPSDVDSAEAILDSFHNYNDKIYNLIKNSP